MATSPDNFMAGALPTQEEAEQQEFEDAYVAFELRAAFLNAKSRLGEDEAKAIIEQELQRKQRTH